MTELEAAQFMARAVNGSTRAILDWELAEELTAEDLGAYTNIVLKLRDELGLEDDDSLDDSSDKAVRAISEWLVWEQAVSEVALDYDESQGDRSTSLSQMGKGAQQRANRFYFDALKYMPARYSVKRHTAKRAPSRFGVSASARKDALPNA